jgi:hypothetical protein
MSILDLLYLQQHRAPTHMQIDTHFQLPKFLGYMNGETINSWIHSLYKYFHTCPDMTDEMNLQIASLQIEGISQTWWDTQLENYSLFIDIGDPVGPQTTNITTWVILGVAHSP